MTKKWSKEEENFLINNFSKLTYKELAVKLNVSENQINKRARLLNLNKKEYVDFKWTEEKDNYLRENISRKTYKELAENLNASINQILRRKTKLNLKKDVKEIPQYTKKEVDFIKENFFKMTYKEISAVTGLKNNIIFKIANEHGMSKGFKLNEEEINFIKNNAEKLGLKKVSEQLNLPYKIVLGKAFRMGIRTKNREIQTNRTFGETEKQCNKCKKIFPKTNEFFSKSTANNDGLNGICKVCCRERDRIYRMKNRDILKQKTKLYNLTLKGKESQLKSRQIRRFRMKNSTTKSINEERKKICLNFFGNRCAITGEVFNNTNKMVWSYITPLSKGGKNDIENIIPISVKYKKRPLEMSFSEWYKKQEFYQEFRIERIIEWIGIATLRDFDLVVHE